MDKKFITNEIAFTDEDGNEKALPKERDILSSAIEEYIAGGEGNKEMIDFIKKWNQIPNDSWSILENQIKR